MANGVLNRPVFSAGVVILGALALVCLLFPALAIIAAFSLIGAPIAFAMPIIPPIFIFVVLVRLFNRMLGEGAAFGWLKSFACAAALLAVIPLAVNVMLELRARSYVSKDIDQLKGPLSATTLAVRAAADPGLLRTDTLCNDFCLRALLSGTIKRLIVVEANNVGEAINPAAVGKAFRMERRDACPAMKLGPGAYPIRGEGEKPTYGRAIAADRMLLQIASGNCLVEENAKLGEADTIVSIGQIKHGENAYAAGLNPLADTVQADRISVSVRSDNAYREVYRRTGVVTYMLFPLLLPTYVGGYQFELRTGFQRFALYKNIDSRNKYYVGPDRSDVFTKTFGMNLALRDDAAPKARDAVLVAGLDQPGKINPLMADLTSNFFKDIEANKKIDAADAELVLRLLADSRLPIPQNSWAPVLYSRGMAGDVSGRFGKVLFERLRETKIVITRAIPSGDELDASHAADAIARLPDEVIRLHRDDLEWLARRKMLRIPAFSALGRLNVFGADAVPTLLYLIDDASWSTGRPAGELWQPDYLAGLVGLCGLGIQGASAIGPVFDRLDSGAMVKSGHPYRDLTIQALVGFGSKPEDVWKHLGAGDSEGSPEIKRAQFDAKVAAAQKKRDCRY
ncbi:hypothetical protein [Mesorhizobium sp. NZP2077]|uniref:hypothetical protein n=1 Tax=Mesorhizobium sp. NZP2077 TaxID=2483404 RepID=UPI0015575B50|nr:hypothetical protein [Mesorhizobium sp. NZP2077]QKC83365.1 hypothetical protein EB232_18640 [Mesorhizobium sp. NZP2077]QKD16890.1 hypothetical protein HGP13_18420 [Mesorhizobium sp. NZP2077]